MEEESNEIKELLFDYIKESETISKLIVEQEFDKVILNITENCYEKIISMDDKGRAVQIFATGILHYLLTNALITSQRKVEYQEKQIDIVIPDIKTLQADPKKTLVICIPESSEITTINKQISELEKIQPHKDNIWLVLSKDIDVAKRSFVLSKENNSFSNIIFEIAKFININQTSKFKILRT